MTTLEETRFLMKKYNIHPNKNLGQNFLIDDNALELIASSASNKDTVIEIGPGLGTLTRLISERAKNVYAIEIDINMVKILEDRFKLYDNVNIVNADILKTDLSTFGENCKIIANLPYYITTQILTKILKENISDITILIQKEVAQRICAAPGDKDAGAITYFVNYYADAKIIGEVPKESFIPSPKVDSAIVKLERLRHPRVKVDDEKLFFDIIKENFSKRRKTLNNSISNTIGKENLCKIMQELNLKSNIRGEELTIEDFANIANLASRKNKI